MMSLKRIFSVSMLAMVVAMPAMANIASKGYVTGELDAKQDTATAVKHPENTQVGDSGRPVYVDASGNVIAIENVNKALYADTAGTASKATKDGDGNIIADTYQKKLKTGTDGNIEGTGSVTVSIAADTGKITINGTDENTTYNTGNATTSGLTKLYTATGEAADGTMTQAAITNELKGKVDLAQGTENMALVTNTSGNVTTGKIQGKHIDTNTVTFGNLYTDDETNGQTTSVVALDEFGKFEQVTGEHDTVLGFNDRGTLGAKKVIDANVADTAAISHTKLAISAGENVQISDTGVISATDTTYSAATDSAMGLVKSGGDISVATTGAVTVNQATKALQIPTASNGTGAALIWVE